MKTNDFQDLSSLRFYSYAVVTEIYPNGVIEVSPLESMNLQDNGLISSKKKEFVNTHKDEDGNMISSRVDAKNTIRAYWLELQAFNRITAPNVVKNEQVMLYKYSNVDKYYWVDLGHNSLRRLETVVWRFGGLKNWNKEDPESETPTRLDGTNSYIVKVDTAGKLVSLTTSKANEEPVGYTVSIDTKAAVVTITDDHGNFVVMTSLKDTITVNAGNEVIVKAGKKAIIKAPAIVLDGTVYTTKNVYVKGKVVSNGADVNGDVEVSGAVTADEFFGPPPLPGNPHPEPVRDPPESEADGKTAKSNTSSATSSNPFAGLTSASSQISSALRG